MFIRLRTFNETFLEPLKRLGASISREGLGGFCRSVIGSLGVLLFTLAPVYTLRDLTLHGQEAVQLRSDLVLVPVEVTDKKSDLPIVGLRKEDFVLFEDGRRQEIVLFGQDEFPLSMLLLIEVGYHYYIKDAARAAHAVLSRLRPEDEVALMIFDGEPRLMRGFTREKDLVAQELEELESYCTNSSTRHLHRAIYEAANYMLEATHRARRRVLLVVTDNLGEVIRGESERTVLEQLYKSDIVVCGIIIGHDAPRVFHFHPILKFARIDKFVEATGGRMGSAKPGEALRVEKVVRLIDLLRAQYVLGYVPTAVVGDGRVRTIKVELSASAKKKYKDVRLRHRRGYIAAVGKEREWK
jgi:VWFA-related protein